MKFLKFLFILLLNQKFCESKNHSRSLACAFKDIAKSISNQSWEISVVNFGADVAIVDSLIPKSSHDTNLAFKVTKVKKIIGNEEILKLNSSEITIFDSVKTLSKYNNKVEFTNAGPKEFQFFVHIPKATIHEISAVLNEIHINKKPVILIGIFNMEDRTEIVNFQYFIVDEGRFIKIYTFEWFTDGKVCQKRQRITEVNRYNKKTRKWQNNKFKIEKFLDLSGCELTVFTNEYPGELTIPNVKNPKTWNGFLLEIFKDLEKIFKFKMKFIIHKDTRKRRFGPTQMIVINRCFAPSLSAKTFAKNHLSTPYFSAFEFMAVPPGEEYSSYEKLKFPFDYHTWFLIFFTFVAAYLVIFIINFASVRIKNLVYGEQIESPSLNIAAHFFGLGQLVLPRRSFARFLVMSFIIYSLIIRTAWQGKMFEFMNQEMRKPQIETIEEAIDKDYEFYMWYCSKSKDCAWNAWFCDETCGMDER
jgi:hypothetical protein